MQHWEKVFEPNVQDFKGAMKLNRKLFLCPP